MKSINVEYKPTNQSDLRKIRGDAKKLRCNINEITKLADLIPEITTFFAIDPSDDILICDCNHESIDKIIDQNDILFNNLQPESTLYVVRKPAHDVYSDI
eukprot:TRINITY_DN1054_c0_g8_i1.p2 TRINITY_DN1054_c0_g8~~TRINITY_DN1054_c0_g8_i1.p2  ORF type:complete len:100 (+),score=9.04 TRINITY_DN1054_c0_g8_i1:209-508(+)